VLTVPSLGAKIEAQLRGLGCGFLPEPMVRESLARGLLVAKGSDLRRARGLRLALRLAPEAARRRAWPCLVAAAAQERATRRALLELHAPDLSRS
jgi:DNA-binding transcriptional LysR family regulator